ncbi:MAG: hypothetical protein NW203_08280 [Hyphomonadaceae bacterium]|nr:hypothetical protein [Hyphomonadaceae bacterium]
MFVLFAPGLAFAEGRGGPAPTAPCVGVRCSGGGVVVPGPNFAAPPVIHAPAPVIQHGPTIAAPAPTPGCGVNGCAGPGPSVPTPTLGCGGTCAVDIPTPTPPSCDGCAGPIIVPTPAPPAPHVVAVGGQAQASVSTTAIAIAESGAAGGAEIVWRANAAAMASADAGVSSSADALGGAAAGEAQASADMRTVSISATCVASNGRAESAVQTFAGRDAPEDYTGEIYRCPAGARLRAESGGRTTDCAAGQALWIENGRLSCRAQIAHGPGHEAALRARFGAAGEKIVRLRAAPAAAQAPRQAGSLGGMAMDGGVGQGVF